jgi:hypothetical protein
MAGSLSIVVGMGVFIIWISIIGNPHVVETVIGLVLALVAGLWTYWKLKPKRSNS